MQKIERDHQRFRKLVRGKVKSNLGKYITRGELSFVARILAREHAKK